MSANPKTRWWREPLLHFLLIGGLFFALYSWLDARSGEQLEQQIVVDEAALVSFMQFRAKQFDPPRFRAELAAMAAQPRQTLIDEYIREEVLYREALKLGMDREDYIIRRRMVQKLEFITRGLSEFEQSPSEQQLQTFFQQRQQQYRQPAELTLTHIFFDRERHGDARQMAQRELAQLELQPLDFAAALGRGDYFPFHKNYIEKSQQVIASHFGSAAASRLFEGLTGQQLPLQQWFGPIESAYGWHLFLVSHFQPSHLPAFAEVAAQVASDMRREQESELQQRAIDAIIQQYAIDYRYAP